SLSVVMLHGATNQGNTLKASSVYADMTGRDYSLHATNFRIVSAYGNGAGDAATFYDSWGDDTLSVGDSTFRMQDSSTSYILFGTNFGRMRAVTSSGHDTVSYVHYLSSWVTFFTDGLWSYQMNLTK